MAGRDASRQQRGVSFEETWMIRREKENVDFESKTVKQWTISWKTENERV